jgi:hypothetical protein
LLYHYIKSIRRWPIRYYLARDLAARLEVNLAKWKRWSREFLPPDPLGGLQSGFARQYSLKEAFLVALGGFLVGELKFAVPEARTILKDLGPWLKKAGYLRLTTNGGSVGGDPIRDGHDIIYLRAGTETGSDFLYWMRSLEKVANGGGWGPAEGLEEIAFFGFPGVRMINLGGFARSFFERIY